MAWFRWRKNTPVEETPEVPPTPVATEPIVGENEPTPEPDVEPEPTLEPGPSPAVDPEPEPTLEPEPEPDVEPDPDPDPEPAPVPEPTPEPDLTPDPVSDPDPALEPLGADTTVQVAEALVASDAPAPVLAWNPGLRGVVVRIVHTAPSAAGSAADLRAALENGLAAAVGEQSPAPADADPEYPIVLNVTIAEETVDAEVAETLASARKQLARRATRVRLVVDEAPLAEIA